MLKGISPIIPPELLAVLDEMGHGDTLVIADANFPAQSMGEDHIVIRCDGHGGAELLEAILKLFPLDQYVEQPVHLMEKVPGDKVPTPIWDTYTQIIERYDFRGKDAIGKFERFDFYDETRKAYCVIATGERAQYANVMLQKGVVLEDEKIG